MPYAETSAAPMICGMAPELYVNVPKDVIEAVLRKHGGPAYNSGHLPVMVQALTGAAAAMASI